LRQRFDVLIAPYGRTALNCNGNADTGRNLSPLKLFEYMSAGKAIVSSDLTSIQEVLRHEETALLYAPEDLASWVRGLERLREDRELRERLGAAAQKEFEAKYTWKARADRVIAGLCPPAG
ncbi:MAG: glycosyltransferase, partial [Desulfuromonadaceae bacterium]